MSAAVMEPVEDLAGRRLREVPVDEVVMVENSRGLTMLHHVSCGHAQRAFAVGLPPAWARYGLAELWRTEAAHRRRATVMVVAFCRFCLSAPKRGGGR